MAPQKQITEKTLQQPDAAAPQPKTTVRTGPDQAQAHTAMGTGNPILTFVTTGQRYGLPVENVIQIIEMVAITPLPTAPRIVVGVINFRGQVIPVVDMRRRLRAPSQPYSLRTPIVVSELNGHKVGLVVDSVSGVVLLDPAQIDTPDRIFTREMSFKTKHLIGIARTDDGILMLLDPNSFLSTEEVAQLTAAITDN